MINRLIVRRALAPWLLACSALAAMPALAQAPQPAAQAKPAPLNFGTWGVDLTARDGLL
jgi:hypothetical protein